MILENKEQYDLAFDTFLQLGRQSDTFSDKEKRYFEELSAAIKVYEDKHYPVGEANDPTKS